MKNIEAEVISSIVDEKFFKDSEKIHHITLIADTSPFLVFSNINEALKEIINGEVLEDYFDIINELQENNKVSVTINYQNKYDKSATIISDKTLHELCGTENKLFWHNYYNIYGSAPIIRFSRPGFNKDKTKALVMYSFTMGALAGIGLYFILELINDIWTIKQSILSFRS